MSDYAQKLSTLIFKWPTFAYANSHPKKKPPRHKFYVFTALLRHAAWSPFYFPQNAIYFVILSFSVRIILMYFVNHALK